MQLPTKEQHELLKKSRARPYLTPGDYVVKVVSLDEDVSQAGNEMLKLKVRFVDVEGKPALFTHVVCSGSAKFQLTNFLESIGWDFTSTDIDDAVGMYGIVSVADENYQGSVQSKVKRWKPRENGDTPTPAPAATTTATPTIPTVPPAQTAVKKEAKRPAAPVNKDVTVEQIRTKLDSAKAASDKKTESKAKLRESIAQAAAAEASKGNAAPDEDQDGDPNEGEE